MPASGQTPSSSQCKAAAGPSQIADSLSLRTRGGPRVRMKQSAGQTRMPLIAGGLRPA
jgi:hypothetical protein